jgi:L-ascorbate metabolism protein UlaG (beta-lactamase superfamily)
MRVIKKILKSIVIFILALAIIIFLFMQQKSFGKLPSAKRLERIEKSKHYHNGKFENLISTPKVAEGVSYMGMMRDFFFSKGIDRTPTVTLPSVTTDLKHLPEDSLSITWFGHSSYLIHDQGKNILVDPVFSERASPVQFAGMKSYDGTMVYNIEDFPELDMVIISHDHYDHLDYNSIVKLKSKTKKFCVPLGVGAHLVYWGVNEDQIQEFDWWESADVFPEVNLTSTPARHFSGRGFSENKTLWSSYVLSIHGYKIFIGGDSGYDDTFKNVGNKFGPFDLVILECGQYDAQWPYIHMMPEETIQAALDLKAETLLPVHWGKFTLALHPWKEPIERALEKAKSLPLRITTPLIGEPVLLNKTLPTKNWWRIP